MSEFAPQPESVESQIQKKFAHLTDNELIRRMNAAPDFGYDDESFELNRRLALVGLTWRWSPRNQVLIFDPAEEEQGGA